MGWNWKENKPSMITVHYDYSEANATDYWKQEASYKNSNCYKKLSLKFTKHHGSVSYNKW